jgi:hypothetical protein
MTAKIPFCDNQHCKLHEFEASLVIEVLENNFLSTYSRHELSNGKHVCSICLHAIQLFNET